MTGKNNLKDAAAAAKELGECGRETLEMMRGFTREVTETKKLWKENNKSWLIKAGIVLVAFPEPVVSDILGSTFIAVGLLKAKMHSSALYMEDVSKTCKKVFRNLEAIREEGARLF